MRTTKDWRAEEDFGLHMRAAQNQRAIEVDALRTRARKQTDREVLVQQIQRESLRLTLEAFPAIAQRLDGEAARRRVAVAWAAALVAEAGE